MHLCSQSIISHSGWMSVFQGLLICPNFEIGFLTIVFRQGFVSMNSPGYVSVCV